MLWCRLTSNGDCNDLCKTIIQSGRGILVATSSSRSRIPHVPLLKYCVILCHLKLSRSREVSFIPNCFDLIFLRLSGHVGGMNWYACSSCWFWVRGLLFRSWNEAPLHGDPEFHDIAMLVMGHSRPLAYSLAPLTRSISPHCSLCSRARSLTRSWACGTVEYFCLTFKVS